MKFIAIFLLFSLVFCQLDIETEFSKWVENNNKVYDSNDEYQYRLAVFASNLEMIQTLNEASNGGATFALNEFADLSPEEFRGYYNGYAPVEKTDRPQLELTDDVAAPSSFSWITEGKVTAVKNQAQCGSCWAFSATENIESVWMISKGLSPTTMKPLAPQQIVDCDKRDGGCNGGDTITAYEYVIQAKGMDTEASYPYKAVNQACHFLPADVETTISSYKYATTTKNEGDMQTATATVAPLSICVDAAQWQFYNSGVMTPSQCGTSLDHCVQIVGYDVSGATPYWNVRNSWGANWGEKGFIRLEYGHNTCGCAEEATTAVV
jgi:C1A family cysteine protease